MSTPTPTDVKSNEPVNLGFLESRYTDIASLGKGGMGEVYKAYDSSLLKWVAIKLLPGKSNNYEQVVRFQNEAKAASKLKHPNIVTVMDFGKSPEDQLYLVMELVDGRSLSQILEEKGRLDISEALKLAISICDGLNHAHSQGVVHRDLKPSNIVVSSDGTPKIVDFGIAKLPSKDDDQELTKTGVIMGSPLYMSPEQALGDFVDHRSDLYSVGCLLFRMLTGKAPFDRDNPMETMYAHIDDQPPKLSDTEDLSFSPELEALVANLLSKDKNKRIASSDELKYKLIDLELSIDLAQEEPEEAQAKEVLEKEEDIKSASFILNEDELLVEPTDKGMSKGQIVILSVLAGVSCIAIVFGIHYMMDKYVNQKTEVKTKKSIVKTDSDVLNQPRFSKNTCTIRGYNEAQLKAFRKKYNRGDLKTFNFENCKDMGDGLKYFVDLNLEIVTIKDCDITDSGLRFLRDMKYLNYVSFDGNRRISSKGMSNIINLPRLKSVAFKNMDARILSNDLLSKIDNIKFLSFLGTNNMSSEQWDIVAKWPKLEILRLGDFDVNQYDFSQLKKLPKMRKLILRPVYGLTDEKRKELVKYFKPVELEFESPHMKTLFKLNQ